MATAGGRDGRQYCILFYKYHPLTDQRGVLEKYRRATEALCSSLRLTGRILIGLSNDGEGINGTLAGAKDDLDAYVDCMLGEDMSRLHHEDGRRDAVAAFRKASAQFFAELNLPELFLGSPNDFKWSSAANGSACSNGETWFPDLNIKIVKEIISTGGAFSDISTEDTAVGYLTPREWHKEMQLLMEKQKKKEKGCGAGNSGGADEEVETILIDVRNHKECQIGAFAPGVSVDPQTKTFAQFPKWVKENSGRGAGNEPAADATPSLLNNKRILMYCTGGIRCEKASAFVRQVVPQNKGVYHLKGGIHKYLEEFGQGLSSGRKGESGQNGDDECLFVGKNFVFDRRGALDAKGHGIDEKACGEDALSSHPRSIVGKCQYCADPYDMFHPENVCTVCREPILVCKKCQLDLQKKQQSLRSTNHKTEGNCRAEYHCEDHFHLKTCYYTSLHGFDEDELQNQLEQLQLHSNQLDGKKNKQKRRTLRKQMDKVESQMKAKLCDGNGLNASLSDTVCRHCGSTTCTSDCWGFHGGKTRMENQKNVKEIVDGQSKSEHTKHKQRNRVPSNQRPAKRLKRQNDLSEIEMLQLSGPPSQHRCDATGLRVPPPVVRTLRSGVKGRWIGKTVRWLFNNVFVEDGHNSSQYEKDERLEQAIASGLIRINGVPLCNTIPTKASETVLRNMDVVERIVHWHEPPITVPTSIPLTKHSLPGIILSSNIVESAIPSLYCVNKPVSVPIYPSGPYCANSLLMMVEAQEGLQPKSLIPLHRIDRATSGILLCTSMSSVARVVQGRMTSSTKDVKKPPVRKLYLARVKGKFPALPSESPQLPTEYAGIASIDWCGNESDIIEVSAPIAVQLSSKGHQSDDMETQSNAMMHRVVRADGKQSISRFRLISYDPTTNESLIGCCPVTGRGHQLRVHLQLIGFPIQNDVEYGGSVDTETRKKREMLSTQSMLDASATASACLHEESVTADEVKSAVQSCKCCNSGLDGIASSFNSAQLLGSGHAIDLHAYKYRISFDGEDSTDEAAASMDFATDLPSWATPFIGDAASNNLTWLN